MRTSKEIRQYLKQQHWYKDFVHYTKRENQLYGNYEKVCLRGYFGPETIAYAFLWRRTKEGIRVWRHRDYKFRNWYDKK